MSDKERDIVGERLEDWRRRLIDLSYRNRLIKYRPTQATTLEFETPALDTLLADPSRATPWRFYFPPELEEEAPLDEDAADFVDDTVVAAGSHPDKPPQADEIVVRGDLTGKRINRILENLARKSNAEFQDKALRILYIAAGFLDWLDPAREERLSSPLILVPVELRRETARHPYKLYFVDDEEIVINPSLTEKLRRDVQLDLPSDWAWEYKPVSAELDEIEEAVSEPGWSVRRDAVLGLFSFQKFVMYRDLLDNEPLISSHPIIRSIAEKKLADEVLHDDLDVPPLEDLDDVQPPDSDLSILDADATQRRCIEAARRGQSFVMQGPPGTGKSQTIANVIANAIGRGKRVLFVSEKAAALDVVHKRLAAQGLDEFCLLLHGEHAARREVVEALNRSLTGQLVPRPGMSSHALERLKQLRKLLNSTAQLVHLPLSQLGDRSLRDVLGELAQLHAAPSVPAAPQPTECEGSDVRAEFQQIDEIFQRIAEHWHVSPKGFVWRDVALERFSTDEHGRVLSVVSELQEATSRLEATSGDAARLLGWGVPINLRAVVALIDVGRHLREAPALTEEWLEPKAGEELEATAEEARSTYEALAEKQIAYTKIYSGRPTDEFRRDLPSEVEGTLKLLDKLGGRTSAWEAQLLPRLPETRRFLTAAPALLQEIVGTATEAAGLLGQPAGSLTLSRAMEIGELAALAFRGEDRPERDWLVQAGLERVEKTLAATREGFERYQSESRRLLEQYEDSALELGSEGLLRRFTEDHVSALAKLRTGYRQDVKTVKAVRRDRKLPKSIRQDLADLAELRELNNEIDRNKERLARAFGSYFRGPQTDVAALERGIATAKEVIALAAPRSNLTSLSDQVCVGSSPEAYVAQLADRLRSAIGEITGGIDDLRDLVAKADALFSGAPIDVLAERLENLRDAFDDLARLVSELEHGSSTSMSDLATLTTRVELIRELHTLERRIDERQVSWQHTLDRFFRGPGTPWDEVLSVAVWLRRFEQLSNGSIPAALRAKLLDEHRRWPDFPGVEAAHDAYLASVEALGDLFEVSRRAEISAASEHQELKEILQLCADLVSRVDDLYDWIDFRVWREKARSRGWSEFLAELADQEVPGSDVVAAFRRAYWNRRLEALFEEDPGLADRGSTYARWISEFRDLDRDLVRTAADRLIAARNRLRKTHVALPGSQVAMLRNEAGKKRRLMPVRKLLADIPTLLSELKPCLMMSPLTVSHFLAPTHDFDLVIFDEASQVPPQDAINCIYRGTQLIVAGDSRQLPPTPFFQVAEAEETWVEDAAETSEDMESILDSCEALLPQHPLQWHYRSRHEDLIAFSNNHIYNGSLLTFPTADVFAPTKGVRFVYVPDGVYERGKSQTNRREAQVVSERVFEHLYAGGRSVGVIAFNVSQANAISEELDRLRIEHPDLEEHFSGDRLDSVFVKHLESVQGDERDVIIFSVGYGKDSDGKFTMNFGPLNKEGGYRRLNVAVTRARELIELVTSVQASDFSLSENSSRGARLLQEYLRYAASGGASRLADAETDGMEFESSLEAAIGGAITELGYEPVPQVGAGTFRIDIGVRDSSDGGSYRLGIETDGDSYKSTATARDRDRLREEVLTDLNWRIHRIWSLDWVRNRQSELERLRDALEIQSGVATKKDDEDEPGDASPRRERTEHEVVELREALEQGHLPWVVPYEIADLDAPRTNYAFHESINRDQQRDLTIKLVEVEAPVHIEYAIRRLAYAWGVGRVGERVRKASETAIKMAIRRGAVERRGKFLWKPGQQLDAVRSPKWDDPDTYPSSINEISPEEIDLALRRLAEASSGSSDEELITQAARIFGFDRTGTNIRKVLLARLKVLRREE